jgi:hypothetical protein
MEKYEVIAQIGKGKIFCFNVINRIIWQCSYDQKKE